MSDIDLLIKELNKQYDNDVLGFAKDKVKDLTRIHSGAASLDMILGGGWPLGRIVELYGPESAGKTMLTLLAIREAQKLGLPTVFIDAERSLEKKNVLFNNVDMDKLLYVNTSNGERVFDIIRKLLKTKDKGIIVVDSVAALVPEYEEGNEVGKQSMGLVARLMSKGLRIINNDNKHWTIFFINQTRQKIGIMFGNPETTPGGQALRFFAALRIAVTSGQKFGTKGLYTGHEIKLEVVKSKVGIPRGVTNLSYMYATGIDYEEDLISVAEAKGLLEKGGAWYTVLGERIQGRNGIVERLKTDQEFKNKFENLIK